MTLDIPPLEGDDLAGFGSGDNPASVKEVRALARRCTDGVPFLLVPVRIETRFDRVELPRHAPVTATAELAGYLAAAASALEALAGLDYRTGLPPSTRARKEYKRTVEDPLVQQAGSSLDEVERSLAGAEPVVREVGEAPESDVVQAEAAMRRLGAALPRARAALAGLRSAYHRDLLLTRLAAATGRAETLLAEAERVVRPAAEMFAALREAAASGPRAGGPAAARVAFTAAPDERRTRLPRMRLVDSARAYAALRADLAALEAAAGQLAALGPDPVRGYEHLLASGEQLTSTIDAALARCTDIALLPSGWRAQLRQDVARVGLAVRAAVEPAQRAGAGGGAVANTALAAVAGLGRLAAAVEALATDGPVPDPAAPGAAARPAGSGYTGPPMLVDPGPARVVDVLRVRIFPDDFAVVTHEEPLTAAEEEAGLTYWAQAAATGGDNAAYRAAWRALAAKHGTRRAAWVARQTAPERDVEVPPDLVRGLAALQVLDRRLEEVATRRGDRLDSLLAAAQAAATATRGLVELPRPGLARLRDLAAAVTARLHGLRSQAPVPQERWDTVERLVRELTDSVAAVRERPVPVPPDAAPARPVERRKGAWTLPPRAGVMPERFVVVTVSGDQVSHVVAGTSVPADLTLGLDPREERADAEAAHIGPDGALVVGESLRWMVDYDVAVAKGMAVTVPITAEQAQAGFDRVYVLGLVDADPAQGATRLQEVLDNHHYGPTGLALLPVGTPTNSTDRAASPFRSTQDPDAAFDIEQRDPLVSPGATPAAASDGWRLASALGVSPDVFAHVANADGRDIADALLVAAALWPATMGYAVEELLGEIVGLDAQDRLRAFGTRHVLGRGWLPALRVGPQPYGTLVTTALSRYLPDGGDVLPPGSAGSEAERRQRFEVLLRDVLRVMHGDWARYRQARVSYAHRPDAGDPQQQVLQMLGLDSTGVAFEHRFALNVGRPGAFAGALSLQVGIPKATDPPPQSAAGPFRLLERFAEVIRSAGGLGPGPLLERGKVAPPFDTVYDRLLGSRGYEVRYLDGAPPLAGEVVPGPATDPLPSADLASRIGALLAATPEQLARSAAEQQPQPLLLLLLRQALLVQARDTALRIAVREGLATPDLRARIGSGELFRIATLGGDVRVSRWSYLLARLSRLNGLLGLAFPGGPGSLYGYLTAGGSEQRLDDYLAHRGDNPLYRGFPAYRGSAGPGEHEDLLAADRAHAGSVGQLAAIPPARLEQLTREHLDVCSHRLDAWLLGQAHRRLDGMRAAVPAGIHLGAFGWVEALMPKPAAPLAAGVPAVLDTDPRSPVRRDPQNQGFVHAPSLNHAVAAAILRSGYLAQAPGRGGTGQDVDSRMAVNLSSRRVRTALDLLDGIGAGNDLGSLLGYQFERDLHDAFSAEGVRLDDLIAPLRRAFPSVAPVDPQASQTHDGARLVVDGLRLLSVVRDWVRLHGGATGGTLLAALIAGGYALYPYGVVAQPGGPTPAGTSLLPPLTQPARLDAVLHAVDRLADTVDAVGDLVLTEGVYQIVQGNHPRAAAVLSALGEGRLPPRPEVVDTPVAATRVAHRVLLHFAPVDARTYSPALVPDEAARAAARRDALPAGWADLPMTARAAAEPTLNRWLGELLGPPGATRVAVVDDAGEPVTDVSLRALEVQPLDLLAAVHGGFEDGLAELSARVLDTVRPIDVRDGEPAPVLQVSLDRRPGWPAEVRSLPETAALLENLATVVAHWRPAVPADYVLADTVPGAAAPAGSGPDAPGPDVAELAVRVTDAVAALAGLALRLLALLSDGADADPALLDGDAPLYVAEHREVYRGGAGPGEPMARLGALWLRRADFRQALLDATGFGVTGATPPARWTSQNQVATAFLGAAEAAFVEVATRLRAARQRLAEAEAATEAATGPAKALVGAWLATGRAVFGDSLPLLPHLRLSNEAELAAGLAAGPVAEPQVAVSRWLQGVAPVRETLSAFTTALAVADAFGAPPPAATPVQLPVREGEPWLGESWSADAWPAGTPDGDRLSLVLLEPQHLPAGSAAGAAALVDAWQEVVPTGQAVTGVSFHYDQPDARPPQCMLLAVPPRLRGNWEWEDLLQTMHDTLELAKDRAVEPEHLRDDVYGQLLPALLGEIAPLGAGGGLSDHRVVLDFGLMQPQATQ